MAIYNIEAREQKGMIIGDQTGISKGACYPQLWYVITRFYRTNRFFITENQICFRYIQEGFNLQSVQGILVPFIVNGKRSKTDIKDENEYCIGLCTRQETYFKDMRITFADFVLATYSQFLILPMKTWSHEFLLEVAKEIFFTPMLDGNRPLRVLLKVGEFYKVC